MPLIFLAAAILVMLAFCITRIKAENKKMIICSCMALVVWASVLYQFIHIAQYVDETGESIPVILGSFGLAFSWMGLIVITLLMLMLLFEAIKKMRYSNYNKKRNSQK